MAYDAAGTKEKGEVLSLERAVQMYEAYLDATSDARNNAEVCRSYYHHKQWTKAEESTLKTRKQPVQTNNRIAPKVDYLLGAERQGRTDPRAYPRNPQDEGASEAATDALRYSCDRAKFSDIRSEVFEDILVPGAGGAIVEVEKKRGQWDVTITRIPWDRLWYDPHSRRRDFKDARHMGVVTWLDEADAKEKWPEKAKDIEYCCTYNDADTHEDKPKIWADPKRKRVKVLELYWHGPKGWMRCVYTKGCWLENPVPSPYEDEYGEPVNPIEAQSGFIDEDNNRYGPVHRYISIQDGINKRESKLLHLVSVRQTWGNRQAVQDPQAVKNELAKPDGHVDINAGKFGEDFGILPTGDMAEGQMLLLQQALSSLDAVGANAALQGKQDTSQSGRAIQARQQGGQVELGPLFDGLRQWSTRIYEQVWMRIKQYWKEPMWVRVTDDEQKLKYVGLNQDTTVGQQILEQAKAKKLPPEQMAMLEQQLARDPRAQLKVKNNDVSKMDVDIIIDSSPDVVSLQGEQFETLAELAKVSMASQNPKDHIPFKALVMASSLRDKAKIIEMMEGGETTPEQQQAMQAQQQFQQAMAQADLMLKQAQAEKTKAEAAKAFREAQMMTPEQPQQPQVPEAVIKAQAQIEAAKITSTIGAEAEIRKVEIQQAHETHRATIQAETDRYRADADAAKAADVAVLKAAFTPKPEPPPKK